ncbi:MAG: hypothetical protein AAF467_17700 [Actinomycetota bacterium]
MRRVALIAVAAVLTLGACVNTNQDNELADEDQVSQDPVFLQELFDGWPAPESFYEVRDLTCVKLDDRVEATYTLENLNDFSWAYNIRITFHTNDGQQIEYSSSPGFWEPGQAIELSDWTARPEEFDDNPRCDITINHGPDLALQRNSARPNIYRRIGWDPETETRTDGT